MTAATQTVRLPRVEIAYTITKRPGAQTVVLAHSLFMDRSMFDETVELLSADFTVVAYDARGHGESSMPSDDRFDMEALYDDAARLIEALDLGPVHYAGNSMGGFVALRLASRRPELLRSAIAMGSSGDAEDKTEEFGALTDHIRNHGGKGLGEALSHVFFGDDSLASDEFRARREYWFDRFEKLPTSAAAAGDGVVYRSTVNPELHNCDVPILALAGGQDHAYSVELSEAIAASAPLGRMQVVDGVGHSVAMEKPAETAAALRDFILSCE